MQGSVSAVTDPAADRPRPPAGAPSACSSPPAAAPGTTGRRTSSSPRSGRRPCSSGRLQAASAAGFGRAHRRHRAVALTLPDTVVECHNPNWADGQATSLQRALDAAVEPRGERGRGRARRPAVRDDAGLATGRGERGARSPSPRTPGAAATRCGSTRRSGTCCRRRAMPAHARSWGFIPNSSKKYPAKDPPPTSTRLRTWSDGPDHRHELPRRRNRDRTDARVRGTRRHPRRYADPCAPRACRRTGRADTRQPRWPVGRRDRARRSVARRRSRGRCCVPAAAEPQAAAADVERVAELIGRRPLGRFDVVVRDVHGSPVVIRNDPLLEDGTPMPTRFWLVGREASIAVSRLEAAGGVRAAEARDRPRRDRRRPPRLRRRARRRLPADASGPGAERRRRRHPHRRQVPARPLRLVPGGRRRPGRTLGRRHASNPGRPS